MTPEALHPGKSSILEFHQPIQCLRRSGQSPSFHEIKPVELHGESDVEVSSYAELVQMVSHIAYKNPNYVLFFRGQTHDSRVALSDGERFCLFPTIFRFRQGNSDEEDQVIRQIESEPDFYSTRIRNIKNLKNSAFETFMESRFERLRNRSNQLKEVLQTLGRPFDNEQKHRLSLYPVARWSMLRHYECAETPFLDITISARVACSFAVMDYNASTEKKREFAKEGWVYVLGLPQVSGHVTVSAESHLKVVRLLSMAPPFAERPNFQEAYLAGCYPVPTSFEDCKDFRLSDFDLMHRVICRFHIKNPQSFEGRYTLLDKGSLMPESKEDPFRKFIESVTFA